MRSAARYDGRSIVLHWLTALLVGMLWLSAQFIDFFPKGPSRWNMLGVHMVMGCWRRPRIEPLLTVVPTEN